MAAGVPAEEAGPVIESEASTADDVAASDDELLLGAETIVPEDPKVFDDAPAEPAAPEPGRRRWLSGGSDAAEEDVPAQPRVKLGGTLFERMQNASRGAARSEDEGEGKDSLDIPRFLNRQNNQ